MKMLQMHPMKHEIELWNDGIDDGMTTVHFQFGDTRGTIVLFNKEAKRIGEWFTALAKELVKK